MRFDFDAAALAKLRPERRPQSRPPGRPTFGLSRQSPLSPLNPLRPPMLPRPRDAVTFGAPLACPNHYVVQDYREAYRRVLLPGGNPTPQYDRSQDVAGTAGHRERANAWTHLLACVLFCGYALARVWLIDAHSFASQLSGLTIVMSAVMFATSTLYHVFRTVPGCSGHMRTIDHTAIYMTMGVGALADAAMATDDFSGVSVQCILDPILATTALATYFTVRRFMVPQDETRANEFEENCQLGLFRFVHSDLEHAGLRTGGTVALMFFWVLLLPAAVSNLSSPVVTIYVVGRVLGTVILFMGVIFDNAALPDRALAGQETSWNRAGVACGCASKELGCVMNAHAWWHVLSLVATIILTASREYGVSQMAH